MEPLTVPGVLDSLSPVGSYVMQAAGEAGLSKKASYGLRLAVDEVLTNIIVHGYEEAGISGDVTVTCETDEERLKLVLEDSAMPFDP
ncbi:MAG: ATP-binding protein, partial [Chloroflexi bacterium]|nr:ATP-binding protein [Chloroflexota bacterium]